MNLSTSTVEIIMTWEYKLKWGNTGRMANTGKQNA